MSTGPLAAILLGALAAASVAGATELPEESERWVRVGTAHFTVLGNASESRTAAIARNLERLREVLSRTSSGMKFDSSVPTQIYVFKDAAAFASFNRQVGGKPANTSGFFIAAPDGNYMAIDAGAGEEPFHLIYHEYLHYVLDNSVPNVPLWLNEGLAEFYGSFRVTAGGAEIGHPVPGHLDWLAEHPLLPLAQLFAIDEGSPDYNEEDRQGTYYAQCWALAHYLVAGSAERRERLSVLFDLIQQGTDAASAFQTAVGIDLPAADKELDAYVRARGYKFYRYTPAEPFGDEQVASRPLARKEVLFHLGDLLAHVQPIRYDDAERFLRAALAQDPAYAEPYVTLAFLDLLRERPRPAAALCEKALALDAKSARAYALHGTSLLAQFASGTRSADDRALLLRAREQLRKGLELAPDHVESLAALGRTFLLDHERVGIDEGVSALARAAQLRPARPDLLIELIGVTGKAGNLAAARSLLDRGLRARGASADVRLAEAALVTFELERSLALREQGDLVGSRAVVQRLMVETTDPELQQVVANAAMTDRFNDAIVAAGRNELKEAAEGFDHVAVNAQDAELRAEAQHHRDEIRRVIESNRHADLYNEALKHVRAGQLRAAVRALETLIAAKPEAALMKSAEQSLRELRAALAPAR